MYRTDKFLRLFVRLYGNFRLTADESHFLSLAHNGLWVVLQIVDLFLEVEILIRQILYLPREILILIHLA